MGYCLPSLEWSKEQIKSADAILGSHLNRFVPPSYKELRKACQNLAAKYVTQVQQSNKNRFSVFRTPPTPTRLEQCNLIARLAAHMEEDNDDHQAILLGAIFHRLLRIKEQQEGANIGNRAENTRLYPVLREMLALKKEDSLKEDVSIDPLTLSQCFTKFKKYVAQEAVAKDIDYIKSDPAFFEKLNEMINTYEEKSVPQQKMLNNVLLLQSLSNQVLFAHEAAWLYLQNATADLKDGVLDKKTVGNSGQNYLLMCWAEDRIINIANKDTQLQELQQLLDAQTRYILLGLLHFCYKLSQTSQEQTTFKSLMSWNLNNPLNIKTDIDDYTAVKAGMEYLDDCIQRVFNPDALAKINFSVCTSQARFEQILKRKISELNAAEEAEQQTPQLTP